MRSLISTNPAILNGKPCVAGTRLSVEFILELIASGASTADIVKTYPQLTRDGVEAAIRFAANSLSHDTLLELEFSH